MALYSEVCPKAPKVGGAHKFDIDPHNIGKCAYCPLIVDFGHTSFTKKHKEGVVKREARLPPTAQKKPTPPTFLYFTLTSQGNSWFSGQAQEPVKFGKTLESLAGLLQESNAPRTISQIAHASNLPEKITEEALHYLISTGYIKTATPIKPSTRDATPKIRIRPIEEIVAAQVRAEASRKKYAISDKGMIVHYKYEYTKGVDKNARYWSGDKGRTTQKCYRLRKHIAEMTQFLNTNPPNVEYIKKLIAESQAELARCRPEEVNV